jgi:hypothetical protein
VLINLIICRANLISCGVNILSPSTNISLSNFGRSQTFLTLIDDIDNK